MRYFIAVLSGTITSFLMMGVVTFMVMQFDIKPYSDYLVGELYYEHIFLIADRVLIIVYIIILPLIAFIASLVAALIAKNKEYLIGLLSIFPMVILFFYVSRYYWVMVLTTSILAITGVRLAIFIKSKFVEGHISAVL